MRALVVDDSLTARNILRQILRELNFDVTLAADSQQAIDSLQRDGKPDVALVDWEMPGLDGLGFVRAVRADERSRDLRIMMVTARTRQSQLAEALEAGADEYVMKPFTKEVIAEKLELLGVEVEHVARVPTEQPAEAGESASEPSPTGLAPVAQAMNAGRVPTTEETHAGCVRHDPIRVLIVDDSSVVRKMLSIALAGDLDLAVADTAADGQAALEKLPQVRPDVVILDLEMPVLGGLDTLKTLRQSHPRLPVIIFSYLAEPGAQQTVEALLLGADDYMTKPDNVGDFESLQRCLREALIPKIKQLADRARGAAVRPASSEAAGPGVSAAPRPAQRGPVEIVVIATSTGGPNALTALLPAFAQRCPVPIVIAQHMPPVFTMHLATRLATLGAFQVREAADGELLAPGCAWIAPGGQHLTLVRRGRSVRFRTSQDPPVNACRPSADVLFSSAAAVFGAGTLAVVMTGMGRDGLDGCRRIRETGGQVLVQDETTSVVWGMPGHVARCGLADAVLPLEELGPAIARRVQRRST